MPGKETTATDLSLPIGTLLADQVDAASQMAARAFHQDPASQFLFPNEARRKRLLEPYMRIALWYGNEFGRNCAPTGGVDGTAVWIPSPGRLSLRLGQLLRCGVLRITLKLRPLEFLRLVLLDIHSGLLAPEVYSTPHLYLWLLAVDPSCQGRGIGSALVQEGLTHSDAAGVPCLLETMTERNVRFYQRHGFEVMQQGRCPYGGPQVWIMRREPQASPKL